MWWDPSILNLNVEPRFGLHYEDILSQDEDGRADESLRRYEDWKTSRSSRLQQGSTPSLSVFIATDAPDPIDRLDAAAVQAELGDVSALDVLAAALAAPQPAVRARAATSLGRLAPLLPDHRALERQLGPLLDDADQSVRAAAAVALLALHPPAR